MFRTVAFSLLMASTGFASAQVLTPEEMLAKINEKVASSGPYADLLNDPDPLRQVAAIELMMTSGDRDLIGMAATSGFHSTDAGVRQKTLEGYLATQPSLHMVIDGSGVEGQGFNDYTSRAGAANSAEGIASVTYAVGAFDETRRCYLHASPHETYCFLQVSNGGIEATAPAGNFIFQGTLKQNGFVEGSTSIPYETGGFSTIIRLLP